jgi:hypothetical protein
MDDEGRVVHFFLECSIEMGEDARTRAKFHGLAKVVPLLLAV